MASARRCASAKRRRREEACENIVKTAHFSTPDGPGAPPGRVVQAGREPPQGRWIAGRDGQVIQAPSTSVENVQNGARADTLVNKL